MPGRYPFLPGNYKKGKTMREKKTEKILTLIPSAKVTFIGSDHFHSERFAVLFQATWKLLPLSARRLLLKHWRHMSHKWKTISFPTINVGSFFGWPFCADSFGNCRWEGGELWYACEIIENLSFSGIMTLIAHELGHAYYYALERDFNARGKESHLEESGGSEQEVQDLLLEWGFDDYVIDEEAEPILKRLDTERNNND